MIQQISAPRAIQLLLPHLLCFSIQNDGNVTKQPQEWMEEIARHHNLEQFKNQQDAMSRLYSELNNSKHYNLELEDANERLQEQLNSTIANNQQLEKQFETLNDNITSANSELEKEVKRLEINLTNSQIDLIEEVATLEQQNKQCQSAVEEGTLELNNLTGRIIDIQNDLQLTRRKADNITRMINTKQREFDGYAREVEDLKNQLNFIPMLVNMRPSQRDRLQLKAVEEGNVTVVKMLLNLGADLSTRDRFGNTPLHRAARVGNVQIAQLLLDAGADIEEVDSYGNTPLIWAAWHGHLDVCMLLLDRGANLNVKSRDYQSTALHYAAFYGHMQIAQLLVQRGAQVNAVDKWGRTPREDAISNRHFNIAEFLRRHSI